MMLIESQTHNCLFVSSIRPPQNVFARHILQLLPIFGRRGSHALSLHGVVKASARALYGADAVGQEPCQAACTQCFVLVPVHIVEENLAPNASDGVEVPPALLVSEQPRLGVPGHETEFLYATSVPLLSKCKVVQAGGGIAVPCAPCCATLLRKAALLRNCSQVVLLNEATER